MIFPGVDFCFLFLFSLFSFHEIKKHLIIMSTLDRFGIRVTIDQAFDLSFGFFKSSAGIEIEKFAKDGVAEYFDD